VSSSYGPTGVALLFLTACSAASPAPGAEPRSREPVDAPVVAAQPGAWFDDRGNLTVVGPGHRLRLVLSAPISPCAAGFEGGGSPEQVATRASLPFHVLSEACRETHPTILLAAESDTASPSELERSYHEVAHCAASDWGLTQGWIPKVVADTDPCPLALGLGWRLPNAAELTGLTVDDRKAVAGALFDTEDRTTFDSLLLYARGPNGQVELATLSPNAAERPPALSEDKRAKPFFGAALRCVKEPGSASGTQSTLPVLPHAAECLRAERQAQGLAAARPKTAALPELVKLKGWMDVAQRVPVMQHSESDLRELAQLLAAPALDRLAQEARDERALTEHYAELAEGLDDPAASPGERERRRAEFDSLRKRLGGQIVHSAEASGTDRTEISAVLARLMAMLENAQQSKLQAKASRRGKPIDYGPLLSRVRELGSGKATKP